MTGGEGGEGGGDGGGEGGVAEWFARTVTG